MKIKPISEVLSEHKLVYPTLDVLQPTEGIYTALLVQPEACITVRDDFIRNTDRLGAHALFSSIAREAYNRQVELFVTPEYSFPWDTLEQLLHAGTSPAEGKLWVLGCESLSLGELDGLKQRFSDHAVVIHEQVAEPLAAARYLDPLVYLFRTHEIETNAVRLVMVVQFKTTPSGDAENIEATRMAKGEDVYLFERKKEVRLISIICSDAFKFDKDIVEEHYEDLLLLHLQLNDRPRYESYMRYRRQLYEYDCDRTEVICLNWAENITFDMGEGLAPIKKKNISASAWHSKSSKFATKDKDIEDNHLLGFYYTYDAEQHRHMMHFSYKPLAFVVEATKVRHNKVLAAMSRRRGPAVTHVLSWDSKKSVWKDAPSPTDDGFKAMTADYGAPVTFLEGFHATSPLAVERFTCITSGEFGPQQDWFEPHNIYSVGLQSGTEVMRRISVTQDPNGSAYRDHSMRTVAAFASIPPRDLPLPPHMKDLQAGYKFDWTWGEPNGNVVSIAKGEPAALIYAGEYPSKTVLSNLFAKVTSTLAKTNLASRFCVFYREGQNIKKYDTLSDRSITKTDAHPGKNFTEPEK